MNFLPCQFIKTDSSTIFTQRGQDIVQREHYTSQISCLIRNIFHNTRWLSMTQPPPTLLHFYSYTWYTKLQSLHKRSWKHVSHLLVHMNWDMWNASLDFSLCIMAVLASSSSGGEKTCSWFEWQGYITNVERYIFKHGGLTSLAFLLCLFYCVALLVSLLVLSKLKIRAAINDCFHC